MLLLPKSMLHGYKGHTLSKKQQGYIFEFSKCLRSEFLKALRVRVFFIAGGMLFHIFAPEKDRLEFLKRSSLVKGRSSL